MASQCVMPLFIDRKKLRILAIHRYFWPDTPPYASILRRIASRWVEDGHRVDVLSTQPSYKSDAEIPKQAADEILDGINVHRMRLLPDLGLSIVRVFNSILFSFQIFVTVLWRRHYDVVMISTSPPIIAGLLVVLASKIIGAHTIYHCMDVHPEIGRISGEFRHPLLFSILRWLDNKTCLWASRVVVLSNDMEIAIKARIGGECSKVLVINNFAFPEYEEDEVEVGLPEHFRKEEGVFRVIFAGNLGRFQGLVSYVDAMRKLSNRVDIEFVFLGGGRAADSLKQQARGLVNVRFIPHQSIGVAKQLICDADLCVVSLISGVVNFAFPSKTISYLMCGRPILVSVDPDSALAKMVEGEAVGMVVPPGDADEMARAIQHVADNRELWLDMRSNAEKSGLKLFSEDAILERWSRMVEEF